MTVSYDSGSIKYTFTFDLIGPNNFALVKINLGPYWQSWADDQLDVTGTAKISPTPRYNEALTGRLLDLYLCNTVT